MMATNKSSDVAQGRDLVNYFLIVISVREHANTIEVIFQLLQVVIYCLEGLEITPNCLERTFLEAIGSF